MFSLTKRQAAILLGVVLLLAEAGWLLYQHNTDQEARLQRANQMYQSHIIVTFSC